MPQPPFIDPAPAGPAAAPLPEIAHVLAYGQSLSSGWEGWPALSLTPRHDSLMFGDSVRPASEFGPHWQPSGEAAFRPLAATVQDVSSGRLLSPAEVAALAPGDPALGETVLEAAVNTWRDSLPSRPDFVPGRHRVLASSCGVGGRSLEALSAGAEPELFNRLRDCARAARAHADACGLVYGIAALLMLQGENNAFAQPGATGDMLTYKRLFRKLIADFQREVVGGIAGQGAPAPVFTYQTGGDYSSDSNSIAQAQLELALEPTGCTLVAPVYPVTSKGGHLDANGYRWLGAQFGKVMAHVLTHGRAWRPLYPRRITSDGTRIDIDFHVPVPPLDWGRPVMGHKLVDIADAGFAVDDAAGPVEATDVAISGPTSVRIALARPLGPGARLRYADRTRHFGRGCLHDSDATVAAENYIYDPTTGHYPSADIPELRDRPYPLMNWCVAFNFPIRMA